MQAHTLPTAVAVDLQGTCDMEYRPGGIEQHRPERRLAGPEGNGVEAASPIADQAAAYMAFANRLGTVDAHARERKTRQCVARAIRSGALDQFDQLSRRRGGR